MQDYNYVKTNCFEITLELGCNKFPVDDLLSGFWDANKYPLIVYMGQVRNRMCLLISKHPERDFLANSFDYFLASTCGDPEGGGGTGGPDPP